MTVSDNGLATATVADESDRPDVDRVRSRAQLVAALILSLAVVLTA